jgi:hypothetical protein
MNSDVKPNLRSSFEKIKDVEMTDDEWQSLDDHSLAKQINCSNTQSDVVFGQAKLLSQEDDKDIESPSEEDNCKTDSLIGSIANSTLDSESESNFRFDFKYLRSWISLFTKKLNKSNCNEEKVLNGQESKNSLKACLKTSYNEANDSSYLNSSHNEDKDKLNDEAQEEEKNGIIDGLNHHRNHTKPSEMKYNRLNERCQNLVISLSEDEKTNIKDSQLTQFEKLSIMADYIDDTTNSSDSDDIPEANSDIEKDETVLEINKNDTSAATTSTYTIGKTILTLTNDKSKFISYTFFPSTLFSF